MKHENKRPITVEDLLRLKRAERPPAEFWPQFERELRAKQLAAIVERRPWWRSFPQRALSGFARYHLPIGASAVLALTFISVRQYQGASPERALIPNLNNASVVVSPPAEENPAAASNEVAVASQPAAPSMSAPAIEDFQAPVIAEQSAPAVAAPLSGNVSAMSALVGVGVSSDRKVSPSERSIAENLAAAQDDAPFRRSVLVAPRGFETRVLPARTIDPLAQVTPPAEVRRSRYLGTALPVSATVNVPAGRSSESLANRLSDERLYESISRYGVGGDHLVMKF